MYYGSPSSEMPLLNQYNTVWSRLLNTKLTSMIHNACCHVEEVNGKGNSLIADIHIQAGELILSDFPYVKNISCVNHQSDKTCLWCGVPCNHAPIPMGCECGLMVCSSACHSLALRNGHQWLCAGYAHGAIIDKLTALDKRGHHTLALILLCKTAQEVYSAPLDQCDRILADCLKDTHVEDYCHVTHALRSGNMSVHPELFDSFIAPAYFEHIAASHALLLDYMSSDLIKALWANCEDGHAKRSRFLASEWLNEIGFRRILGTFLVNNLQIDSDGVVGTGLYRTFAKMNHSCANNAHTVTRLVPATVSDVDVAEVSDNCAEVAVYALRDIQPGEEITVSYLHVPDPRSLTRRERKAYLLQYLFVCQCELCMEQKLTESTHDSDTEEEDDDDDDDDEDNDNC